MAYRVFKVINNKIRGVNSGRGQIMYDLRRSSDRYGNL